MDPDSPPDRDEQPLGLYAGSFGVAAAAYERGRPPYPPQALDWLLPAGVGRVLDLGAGTGKLTRALRERGLDVVAVEPSSGMREQLKLALPQVVALDGRAEAIPLEDDSVDAVLVAQAWHWVDPVRAVPEVARVLRPGGWLGLLWNVRDERAEWVAELGRIMHRHTGEDSETLPGEPGPPFGPVERLDVEWTHRLRRDELIDLITSRSYVITLPADQRASVLADVAHLLDTHPALRGAAELQLPYVTSCFRARLG